MTSLADHEEERLQILEETGALAGSDPALDAICREARDSLRWLTVRGSG
jgi:hypothetical protein